MTIKMLAMDVDGTLTDGSINTSSEGELFKIFDVKDGYGIRNICEDYGIITVIITARESKIVELRSKELGIKEVHQKVHNKRNILVELASKYGLERDQIAYIGDDVNDLPAMDFAGISFSPKDAHCDVKAKVDFVLSSNGGHGAVRECIDFIVNMTESDRP